MPGVDSSEVSNESLSSQEEASLWQKNLDGTLKDFKILREKFFLNPIVGYLNINSLRGNKFHHLMLCTETPIEVLCVDETKLTADFPDAYFKIGGYKYPPFRRDRNDDLSTRGGGKIVFIKDGIILQRLSNFETKTAETILSKLQFLGENGSLFLPIDLKV